MPQPEVFVSTQIRYDGMKTKFPKNQKTKLHRRAARQRLGAVRAYVLHCRNLVEFAWYFVG